MAFRIETRAFSFGATIPAKYTCGGADVSPPLEWSAPPAGAKSLVLIVDDPDAPGGTWYHWLLYNIPAHAGGIWEHVATVGKLPGRMLQGRNSFGKIGYGGPCPPHGKAHRYFFHLYALNIVLKLPAGVSYAQLANAMRGHVGAEAEWMGRYGR